MDDPLNCVLVQPLAAPQGLKQLTFPNAPCTYVAFTLALNGFLRRTFRPKFMLI